MKNRITVKILDTGYTILAEEPQEYVEKIAQEVDKRMRDILMANPHASVTMAAVLTAFNYCDEAMKVVGATDNLRGQIREYIDDVSKYRGEAEEAKREVIRLQNELAEAKNQLSKLYAK